MYTIAKKYLLLGLSLSLVVAAVFFFNQKEITAPQTEIASKKQINLTHIKYEGAVAVTQESSNIDDIIVELDAIETSGTFSLTAMAQSIREEALKAFSDTNEHSLPLLSHWNVNSDAMDPMYMISRIEQGEHILVSWKLDPYYADTIGSSYYEESIKRAAELQLPLVFILPSPESALTKDSYYKSLPKEDNPNVVDQNDNVLDKLSPFGPDSKWNEVGSQWSSTTLMSNLQTWYPNPPLVVFISEDEADKLSWSDLSSSSRFSQQYPTDKDDNFNRTLVGAKWIEKYRQLQNGFKEGFTESAWKNNIKFISHNKISDNFGKSVEWIDDATVTNQYINLWPLTADGTTIDFDLTDTKSDTTLNSPHVLANNLPFMLKEAKRGNSDFLYQLSINDDSKITDPARYRGLTQFALWFLRPNFIRQKSSATTRAELEPMFKEVVDSVELIHYNPQVTEFWKNGKLVRNGNSILNENIPAQYQDDPRWFLLDSDSVNTIVWAFALVKGEAPNREWLIYAQSPENEMSNITIGIPDYGDVSIDSKVSGSFYVLSENTTTTETITTEDTTTTEVIPSAFGALPVDPGMPTITGTSYYVDASTTGTEIGTIENPFKTLAQANAQTLTAGDALLFKKGEKWIGQIKVTDSGTETDRIIIGSYGDGAKPIITQLDTQSITWVSQGNNIWKSDATYDFRIDRVFKNDSEILRANVPEELGTNIPTLVEWFIDKIASDTWELSTYSLTDPNLDTFKYANDDYSLYISNKPYITLYGLDLQGYEVYVYKSPFLFVSYCNIGYLSHTGLSLSSKSSVDNTEGIVVSDCTFDSGWTLDYSEADLDNGTQRGIFNGLPVIGSFHDMTVTRNNFLNWGHSGATFWADPNMSYEQYGLTLSHNYFTAPNVSYGGSVGISGDNHDNEIAYNIFENMYDRLQLMSYNQHVHHNIWQDITAGPLQVYGGDGYAIRLGDEYVNSHDIIIENNILMRVTPGGFYIGGTQHNGVEKITVRNNIMIDCFEVSPEVYDYKSAPIRLRGTNDATLTKELFFYNNIVYSTRGGDQWFGTIDSDDGRLDMATFTTNLLALSDGSDIGENLVVAPLLDSDFTLNDGSPAIGSGIHPLAIKDFYGNTISTTYNIGIWK